MLRHPLVVGHRHERHGYAEMELARDQLRIDERSYSYSDSAYV